MKILYAANVFGKFEMIPVLCTYAKEHSHDATIIAGNVVLDVLPQEKAEAMLHSREFKDTVQRLLSVLAIPQAQQIARGITGGQAFDLRYLGQFAHALVQDMSFDHINPKIREDAKKIESGFEQGIHKLDLNQSLGEALTGMVSQYETFVQHLAEFPGNVYTLPGSFDGKFFNDVLKEKSLHLGKVTIDGIVFAGYGSGNKRPLYTPHELLLDYVEVLEEKTGLYMSLAVSHFMRTEPDVVVSHVPPHCKSARGIPDDFETGALEDYLKKMGPAVVLTGQVPGVVGADLHNPNTVTIYPGSLARGEFCVVDIDTESVEFTKASFYRITDKEKADSIKLMTTYMRTAEGMLEENLSVDGVEDKIQQRKNAMQKQPLPVNRTE